MFINVNEKQRELYQKSQSLDSLEYQSTLLGHVFEKETAERFIDWIETNFRNKHSDNLKCPDDFTVFLDDTSEFSTPLTYCIMVVCHENDWEYLVARLRPAFLAVKHCCG